MNITDADEITFKVEGSLDKHCSIFALYAGLRMYEALKIDQNKVRNLGKPDHELQLSLAGIEAGYLLTQMEEQFPEDFIEAEIEYELKIENRI